MLSYTQVSSFCFFKIFFIMFFNIAEMIFFSEALVAEMCHADPVEARSRVHLPWSLIPGKESSFLSF